MCLYVYTHMHGLDYVYMCEYIVYTEGYVFLFTYWNTHTHICTNASIH